MNSLSHREDAVSRRTDARPKRAKQEVSKPGANGPRVRHFREVRDERLTADGRYINPEKEQVIVVKKVLDSELKHVLWIFGPLLLVAFIMGLILWVVWS